MDLAPTYPMLKLGNDGYLEKFAAILSRLDPEIVAEDVKGKILLCWEKPGDFCHRRLVAEWLKEELDYDIPELGYSGPFDLGQEIPKQGDLFD